MYLFCGTKNLCGIKIRLQPPILEDQLWPFVFAHHIQLPFVQLWGSCKAVLLATAWCTPQKFNINKHLPRVQKNWGFILLTTTSNIDHHDYSMFSIGGSQTKSSICCYLLIMYLSTGCFPPMIWTYTSEILTWITQTTIFQKALAF